MKKRIVIAFLRCLTEVSFAQLTGGIKGGVNYPC